MSTEQTQKLKQKVQELISQAVIENEKQKQWLTFLFRKLEEVKELETLESLKTYKNGIYLKAYLFYQSIKRANYQPEHLELTKLENVEKCLEMIEKDLTANQPKEKVPKFEPTNQQLLTILGERIAQNEIKSDANHDYLYVTDENFNKIITMVIEDGRIKPDPAEEFFKKHTVLSDNSSKITHKN